MKNIITCTLLFAFTLIAGIGCKKGSDSGYRMTANINGATTFNTACRAQQTGTQLHITGQNQTTTTDDFPVIGLYISNYTGPGTYVLNTTTDPNLMNTGIYDASLSVANPSINGSIVITSTIPLKGTFSFNSSTGASITSGNFSCINTVVY